MKAWRPITQRKETGQIKQSQANPRLRMLTPHKQVRGEKNHISFTQVLTDEASPWWWENDHYAGQYGGWCLSRSTCGTLNSLRHLEGQIKRMNQRIANSFHSFNHFAQGKIDQINRRKLSTIKITKHLNSIVHFCCIIHWTCHKLHKICNTDGICLLLHNHEAFLKYSISKNLFWSLSIITTR